MKYRTFYFCFPSLHAVKLGGILTFSQALGLKHLTEYSAGVFCGLLDCSKKYSSSSKKNFNYEFGYVEVNSYC